MATKKQTKKEHADSTQAQLIVITKSVIKDGYCHYEYVVKSGIGLGDKHNVKGVGIIDDDLTKHSPNLMFTLPVLMMFSNTKT